MIDDLRAKFISGFKLGKKGLTVWFFEVYMFLKPPKSEMRFCVVFLLRNKRSWGEVSANTIVTICVVFLPQGTCGN